jgi:mannitol/fructose-specific phosphotransferase system IIA component
MSIKTKIMNIVTAHPKLVTFGSGMTVTFVIGIAIGMVENNHISAYISKSIGNRDDNCNSVGNGGR